MNNVVVAYVCRNLSSHGPYVYRKFNSIFNWFQLTHLAYAKLEQYGIFFPLIIFERFLIFVFLPARLILQPKKLELTIHNLCSSGIKPK